MATVPADTIPVGKWSVGFSRAAQRTILQFEFTDHPAITLAIAPEDAAQMARAILAQSNGGIIKPQ